MQTHGPEWIHTVHLVDHAKTSWNDPRVASGALPTRRCHGPPRAALRAFVSIRPVGEIQVTVLLLLELSEMEGGSES